MSRLLLLLLLSSCSSVHVSTGLIDPAFGLHLKPEAHDLSALHTSIQLENTAYENDQLKVDIGMGPAVTTPLGGRSSLYGVEFSNRVTYRPHRLFQPFFYNAHGIAYQDTAWHWTQHVSPVEHRGSDVRYTFTTRVGVGVAAEITERVRIDVSYGWYHSSNGKSAFGDKTRQFFGLKKAKTNEGFESGSIFVGITYEF